MKKYFYAFAIIYIIQISNAQISIDYFGQIPPGDTAKIFAPGIISIDGRYELMTAFSADGKEFCFTVTNNEWSNFKIWYTKFDSNSWSEPEIIPFLSSSEGLGPVFSPGNSTMFFSSANWVTHPSNIFCCSRNKKGWGEIVKLDPPVNSGHDQWQCSVAEDSTLLFCSKRSNGKGGYDIYISKPVNSKYTNAVNLDILNSPADEYSAFIAPDKSYIIFSSQRQGVYGWDDLFISFRNKNNTWTNPVNLGPGINTIHAEFSPHVSPDGKYLIYSKWDINSKWSDIYWVQIDGTIDSLKNMVSIGGIK